MVKNMIISILAAVILSEPYGPDRGWMIVSFGIAAMVACCEIEDKYYKYQARRQCIRDIRNRVNRIADIRIDKLQKRTSANEEEEDKESDEIV